MIVAGSWTDIEAAVSRAVSDGLEDLFGALRIPKHQRPLRRPAQVGRVPERPVERDGWAAKVVEVDGKPLVLAEAGAELAPAILRYGDELEAGNQVGMIGIEPGSAQG